MELAKVELLAVEATALQQKAEAAKQLENLTLAYSDNFGGLGDVVGF